MSKSPAFIFLVVPAVFASAQNKPDFDIAGDLDLAPSEHWFDPDKLRQEALAARPDYLAALDQTRKSESDVRLAEANELLQ